MVNNYELLEYIRANEKDCKIGIRRKTIKKMFNYTDSAAIKKLLSWGMIERIEIAKREVYYKLTKKAYKWLKRRKLKSFITGHKRIEMIEKSLLKSGRRTIPFYRGNDPFWGDENEA